MPKPSDRLQAVIGSRHPVIALAAIVALVAVFLAFLVLLKDNYEVLAKGQLLPYTKGFIYKVRFFDRLTLYLEPECRPSGDIVTSFALVGVAAMSVVFATVIARAGGRDHRRPFWMFVLLFLGAGYLASDEILGIHESIGHNLRFALELPIVSRPDDLLVLSYAIPVFLFAYVFRRELQASRATLSAIVLAIILFLLAAVSDLVAGRFEEAFEIGGALILAVSVLALGLHHLATLMTFPDDGRLEAGRSAT